MVLDLKLNEWISVFTSVAGVVIIPFTLLGVWRNRINSHHADRWKNRQEEIGTYNEINIRYIEFLGHLLSNPDVDIGEFDTPRKLSDDLDKYKRNIIYAMLVALMERAYLLYNEIETFETKMREYNDRKKWIVKFIDNAERKLFGDPPPAYETHVFRTQYPGWQKYFAYYCSHTAFVEYWNLTVSSEKDLNDPTQWHDDGFEAYINSLIKTNGMPSPSWRDMPR